jgi:formylglycine-generating enzyme required for sulfatase activity
MRLIPEAAAPARVVIMVIAAGCYRSTTKEDADADPFRDTAVEPDADVPPMMPEFLAISPGSFTMGSPTSELGRDSDETEHTVTLTMSFEIMVNEVTQGQFEGRMRYNPSWFTSCGTDCPVENVNWYEAAAFANALSETAGLPECYTCWGSGSGVVCSPNAAYATPYDCPGYRLPTEAEWEYAARAGTSWGTYNGTSTSMDCTMPNAVLDPIAWFCGNSGVSYAGCSDISEHACCTCAGIHAVGGKAPNAWGLYDMLGNVQEWCHDNYDLYPGNVSDPWGPVISSGRVTRGGTWTHVPGYARAAKRHGMPPSIRIDFLGFRLARTLGV